MKNLDNKIEVDIEVISWVLFNSETDRKEIFNNLNSETFTNKSVEVIDNFELNSFDKSLDIKDFDISFARGLSLEDGCATITNFTAYLIAKGIEHANGSNIKPIKYLVCGGGRKNTFLIQSVKDYLKSKMLENQTLVEITWDSRECDISAFYTPWKSNVTFDNRFFTEKHEILDKINFSATWTTPNPMYIAKIAKNITAIICNFCFIFPPKI